MEVRRKDEEMFLSYGNFSFFFTYPFDTYGEMEHCDKPLSITLRNSKEKELIYFCPIEIYSEKTII